MITAEGYYYKPVGEELRITAKKGGLPTRQSSLLVGAGLSIGVEYLV